ncbi:hypothetical protein Tco_0237326 [Tanacetum coccineum]
MVTMWYPGVSESSTSLNKIRSVIVMPIWKRMLQILMLFTQIVPCQKLLLIVEKFVLLFPVVNSRYS